MIPAGHDADAHALFESVGTGEVKFNQALRQPMRRFGRLVLTQRRPFSDEHLKAIGRAIERHEIKIRQLTFGLAEPDRLSIWRTRAEVLRKMRGVGFRPSSIHVTAALAREHGLGRESLLPRITQIYLLNTREWGAQRALFNGTFRNEYAILKKDADFLARINDRLHETGRAMDSRQLSEELEVEPNRTNRSAIAHALGVLDLIGLTRKIPGDSSESAKYKWISACHRFSPQTIPDNNVDWKLFKALGNGPVRLIDLAKPGKLPNGEKFGSESGIATMNSLVLAALRLESAGLLKNRRVGKGNEARHSAYGKKLWKKQAPLDYLHEETADALLGLARQPGELRPNEMKMKNRIEKWARISQAVKEERMRINASEEQPYAGAWRVARELRLPNITVRNVIDGHIPWILVGPDTLHNLYLSHLKQTNPTAAKQVEGYLAGQTLDPRNPYSIKVHLSDPKNIDKYFGIAASIANASSWEREEFQQDIYSEIWKYMNSLLKSWKRGKGGKGIKNFERVMIAICKNRISVLRRDKRRLKRGGGKVVQMSDKMPDPAYQERLEETAELEEQKQKLREGIKKLGESDRQLIQMFYFDGLDYAKIAEKTGKKYDAIRAAIKRARERLKEILE